MYRCLELARRGAGQVAPNPMVGAVLVHEGRIIGEGYHQQYGGPHAEVHCVRSVAVADEHLVAQTTMYVSLEPCAHFGKTPPCADLIIDRNIPRVVIGCRDPFEAVNGKGIEKLKAAGVEVIVGVLEKDCLELNKRFFTFHTRHRPYILLKWAQTANGRLAHAHQERLFISNPLTNRLVHRWRSEESSILVGTNTALQDDPALTTRLWTGPNPVRLVLDPLLRLPAHLKVLDGSIPTIVFNTLRSAAEGNTRYYQLDKAVNLVPQLVQALYELKIQSVLVEGGSQLLQSFLEAGLWDEARIITNHALFIAGGLPAPLLPGGIAVGQETFLTDTIHYCIHPGG